MIHYYKENIRSQHKTIPELNSNMPHNLKKQTKHGIPVYIYVYIYAHHI